MLLLVGVPLLVSPHLASGHAYWLGVLALAASTVVVPVLLPGDHPGSGGPPPTPSRRVLPHDPDSLRRLHAELEEQKRRLGQELHDELGQLLTGLHYHVETLEAAWTEKGLPPLESLDATKRILDRGLQELHRIVLDLRPQILDDFGLAPALRWCAREYLENTGIAVRLRLEPMERLTTERETALFRIAQEAFTNILRHARAGHVSVALWETEDSLVHLRIRDDGGGFDTSGPSDGASRVGLRSMYERARLLGGSCTVVSDKDRGAELIAVIPR
jgi:signal transduction histidine kinase